MRMILIGCFIAGCSFSSHVGAALDAGAPGAPDTSADAAGAGGADAPPPVDTDGDGVPDATDNCVTVPNADQRDHDGDGRGDACDVCPERADDGADRDGDGVGDACDPRPSQPGDRIVMFEDFDDAPAWNTWDAVIGPNTWVVDAGAIRQPYTDAAYQLVDGAAIGNVFVETRLWVAHDSPSLLGRAFTGLVLGYQATDDFLVCGVATNLTGAEVDAGRMRPVIGLGDDSATFDSSIEGAWITLQARTTQGASGTHVDCLGASGDVHATASYDASTSGTGSIGLRTDGTDTRFDYVFVVATP